jgi:hypothetical protein
VTACTALPTANPGCSMLGSVTDTNTRYVDHTNNRVYTFDTGTGKTYPQAQAACAAITYAGVTGKGYLVSWNTWVAAQAAGAAKLPAACCPATHGRLPASGRRQKLRLCEWPRSNRSGWTFAGSCGAWI